MPLPSCADHPSWTTLCHGESIAEGQARGFDLDGQGQTTVFVLHWQGQWRAWHDWCPHWRTGPMAWRRDAYFSGDGQSLMCHAHGARFDPLSGACTLGPCQGQALWPVALRLDPAGWVQIDPAQGPPLPAPEAAGGFDDTDLYRPATQGDNT
jgi:nitrite reductase/ring-hydroxylating ferredoxin subunit